MVENFGGYSMGFHRNVYPVFCPRKTCLFARVVLGSVRDCSELKSLKSSFINQQGWLL